MSIREHDEAALLRDRKQKRLLRTRLNFVLKYGDDAYDRLMRMADSGSTLSAMGDAFGGLSKQRMNQLLKEFLGMPYAQYRAKKKSEAK